MLSDRASVRRRAELVDLVSFVKPFWRLLWGKESQFLVKRNVSRIAELCTFEI